MNEAGTPGKSTRVELARRALRTLAERQIIPTPESFAEIYYEVAGAKPGAASPVAVVKDLLRDLSRAQRLSAQEVEELDERLVRHDWPAVRRAVDEALPRRAGELGGNWPELALSLLRCTEALPAGDTRARRIQAASQLLASSAGDPADAYERLQQMLFFWGMPDADAAPSGGQPPAPATGGQSSAAAGGPAPAPGSLQPLAPAVGQLAALGLGPVPAPANAGAQPGALPFGQPPAPAVGQLRASGATLSGHERSRPEPEEAALWQDVALRAMRLLSRACGEDSEVGRSLAECVQRYAGPVPAAATAQLLPTFSGMVRQLEHEIGEAKATREGLPRLLTLLCDNLADIAPEDVWLTGPLEPVRALLAGPITVQSVNKAQTQLVQSVRQQASARQSMSETKFAIKELLATVIDQAGAMGNSTGRLTEQLGRYQRELEQGTDLAGLSRVISGVLSDTRTLRADIASSREELLQARQRAEAYEQRVRQLEGELTKTARMAQKDPLTQALNRRGLQEIFRVETARALRQQAEISLAMLDLDDFKRLNDELGHLGGDRALVHFFTVLQTAVRPTDVTVRVGGEEFAVLLPGLPIAPAKQVIERILQQLATQPFEYETGARVLTFSAGVALWRRGESLESLLHRADVAMYGAKRAGKNRVLSAEAPAEPLPPAEAGGERAQDTDPAPVR